MKQNSEETVMTSEFDRAFRQMLKSVVQEVADEVLRERKNREVAAPTNQPDHQDRILLRASEAAERMAISQRTLFTMTVDGELPCVRIGRLVRYSVETIERWFRESESTD